MAELNSKAYVRLLDLVSEGPIKGWVHPDDPAKDIYLNDTPLKGPDGNWNFHGVDANGDPDYTTIKYDYRLGTADQTYMPGIPAAESEQAVGAQVDYLAPIVRSFSDANLTSARVNISWQSLFHQNDDGTTSNASCTVKISLSSSTGVYAPVFEDYIEGKVLDRYQRSYLVPLTGEAPWTIKVERLTADDSDLKTRSTFSWDSYAKIVDAKLRYPFSALVDISADASAFQGYPSRSYDLYLKIIKIPTNYDPVTRRYTGTWDGTFKEDWSDNAAWVWYDIATNPRYGLGRYVDLSTLDKWALYEISRYCDAVDSEGIYVGVPDGKGGVEPRFTCNVYLTTREEAFNVLNNLASVFRSMVYWNAQTITLSQDAPTDPSETQLFNSANVVDGAFSYQGSSRSARHTVALITWNDPDDGYRQKVEYVEHAEGIARYGIRQIEMGAVGCTSRGQANRLGKWLLYTDQMETETLSFQSGLDGMIAYPGKIIRIQDANRVIERYGGRILGVDGPRITLDDPIEIEAGKSYKLEVMLPDMTLATATVTSPVGTYTEVEVYPPYPQTPQLQAVWVLAVSDLEPTTWRIISVDEAEPHLYNILAVAHNSSKFDYVDFGIDLQIPPVIRDPNYVPAPFGITITESHQTTPLAVKLFLTAYWESPAAGLTYLIEWQRNTESWWAMPILSMPEATIEVPSVATYRCRVTSIDSFGRKSVAAYSQPYVMVGKVTPPTGISSLVAVGGLWEIKVDWTFYPEQYDLETTEVWASAMYNNRGEAQLITTVAYPGTNAKETNLPNGTQHWYWVRTKNTSGIYSAWYPESPYGGVSATTESEADKILALLSGEIAGSLAGQSLVSRLAKLDYPGTGVVDQLVNIQTEMGAVTSIAETIGARIEPGGDIATSIATSLLTTAVYTPTPRTTVAPANPSIGTAWYDANAGYVLKYWNGTAWVLASSAASATTAPADPTTGFLWKDTSTSKNFHKIWDGTVWVYTERPTTYNTVAPTLTSSYVGDTWVNTLPDPDELMVCVGTAWVSASNLGYAGIADQVVALSGQVTQVETSVDGLTSSVAQTIASVNGLGGLYSVKFDNNGHISGFSLSSQIMTTPSAPPMTYALFSVDRFAVAAPGYPAKLPFAVVTTGPSPGVYMDAAYIKDASVSTLKIQGQAVTVPNWGGGSSAGGNGTLASCPLDSEGQPVIVMFTGTAYDPSPESGQGFYGGTILLQEDGVEMASTFFTGYGDARQTISLGFRILYPGTGTHTYSIVMTAYPGHDSAYVSNRSLTVLGCKR